MIRTTLVAALATLSLLVGCATQSRQEQPPLAKATPEQQKMFPAIKAQILKEAAEKPKVLTDSPEAYFWDI